MQVQFSCSECGAVLEADGEMGGGISPCPNCGTLLLVPAPAIRPGTTIGGFYIERKLGSGAMGEVYLATQLTIEREVALKVLPPALVQDKGSLERFLREVRLAGGLNHPNIVSVHAAGEDQGVYYLAMSFVSGDSLQERLDNDGALPEKRALDITRKIADALAYAWDQHRLVHRDVKPANIMIDKDDEPKLLDMGLAKRTAVDIGMTAAGLVVGTPAFMSPEQADPAREVDFRSDMYSLGATLYAVATGKRPFPGKTAQEVLRKVSHGLRIEPKTANPELSDACNALIMKMMARKASQRYTTWKACIADFDAALHPGKTKPRLRASGTPPAAVVPPPVQPSAHARTSARRSGSSRLTGVILAAAAIGAGWWLYSGRGRHAAGGKTPPPVLPTRKVLSHSGTKFTARTPKTSPRKKPPVQAQTKPPPPIFQPAATALLNTLNTKADSRAAQELRKPAQVKAIAKKIGVSLPVSKPVLTREQANRAVKGLIARETARQLPASREDNIRKQAEEKFKLYRLGKTATVRLVAPRGAVDHVTGVFLGVRDGKAIIGPQRVPVLQIVEEDRVRLQAKLAEEEKKKFIHAQLLKLSKQRRDFAAKIEPRIRKQVMKPAGYVQVRGKWLSAAEALNAAVAAARKKLALALRPPTYLEAGLIQRRGKWGKLVHPKTARQSAKPKSTAKAGKPAQKS